jgi:hypothetical protein
MVRPDVILVLSLVFVGFEVVKAIADIEFSSTVHIIKYIFGSDELG